MTSAAIRKALLRWPRAALTGIGPSLSLWLGLYGGLAGQTLSGLRPSRDSLFVRRLELGGQRRELVLEAAASIGPGQAADLYRGALLASRGRAGPGADEDPPAADHER